MDIKKARETAEKELQEEEFRKAVDKHKEKLRKKKSLWDYIFPYKVIFIKKGDNNV